MIDRSIEVLYQDSAAPGAAAGNNSSGARQRAMCHLDKFSSALRVIFKGSYQNCLAQSEFYRVHIHVKEERKGKGGGMQFFDNKKSQSVGRILSYWCFNPGIAMEEFQQVRYILLRALL